MADGNRLKGRWARGFDQCIVCGTTDRPHKARGMCGPDYDKWKAGNLETPTDYAPTSPPDGDRLGEADVRDPGLAGAEVEPPLVDAVEALFSPGEQSPGAGVGSPSYPGAPGTTHRARPSLKDRLFGKKDDRSGLELGPGGPTNSKEKPPTRPTKPKGPKGKRLSAAETLADGYGTIGQMVVRGGKFPATGRMMMFQAPVAGEMLDDAVAGTFVDRMAVQPVVKARGRFDALSAVFGPPLLVAAIERDPGKADLLIPHLRTSIRNSLPLMVPAIKRLEAKAQAAQEAAEALFADDPNFDPAAGPAEDQIIAMIFGGMIPTSPPPEAPIDVQPVYKPEAVPL